MVVLRGCAVQEPGGWRGEVGMVKKVNVPPLVCSSQLVTERTKRRRPWGRSTSGRYGMPSSAWWNRLVILSFATRRAPTARMTAADPRGDCCARARVEGDAEEQEHDLLGGIVVLPGRRVE